MFQNCQVCEILRFGAFPQQSICCTIHGLNTPLHPSTHSNPTNIHTLYPNALRHLLQVSRDTSGQQQTPTDTNRHQTTPTDVASHPKRLFKDVWQFMLTSIFVCWCLMASFTVLCCLKMSEGCLRSFSRGI